MEGKVRRQHPDQGTQLILNKKKKRGVVYELNKKEKNNKGASGDLQPGRRLKKVKEWISLTQKGKEMRK